jgi:hypothetical protein
MSYEPAIVYWKPPPTTPASLAERAAHPGTYTQAACAVGGGCVHVQESGRVVSRPLEQVTHIAWDGAVGVLSPPRETVDLEGR